MTSLARFLAPESVAVVGASEKRRMSDVAMAHLSDAPVELHLVNPNSPQAYGRPTVPDLGAVGAPVDAVLSLVGAERSVAVVEEAARLGCGGVVVVASGFSEVGEQGEALQDRLAKAAAEGDLAVCGPNCTGFSNVDAGVSLFTGTGVDVRRGGISLVSSSGYLMRSAMVAAHERNLGMHLAVSAGNEAVTTMVDYLDLLVEDPRTSVIAAVLEKVRHPEAFFAVASRARASGKALIVLKLGRSERARDIVRSHTGALTGEGWVYDVAFKGAGIVVANDVDDLMDRAAVLAQLPPGSQVPVERIALLASSGGVAALASDTIGGEDIELPRLDALLEPLRRSIPAVTVANPLDLTGFTMTDPEAIVSVLETFRHCEEVDAIVVCWWIGEQDRDRAALLLEPARRVAGAKPVLLASVEESRIGPWTSDVQEDGVVFVRGLRGAARGLAALRDHSSPRRPRPPATRSEPISRPSEVVVSDAGPMLRFAATMDLLAEVGIPVAPWVVLDDAAAWEARRFGGDVGRFVVKLADVAHRSELGAVRLGVEAADVPDVASDLAAVARGHDLPTTVAVQAHVEAAGEAFVGAQGRTDLGPIVVVGLGGVLVELTRTVVGRLLPVDELDIDEMLDELGSDTVFAGLRGAAGWDRRSVAAALGAAAGLVERSAPWIASLDINPLMCDELGCTAVDALVIVRD